MPHLRRRCLLISLLMLSGLPVLPAAEPVETELEVISFNLRNGGRRFDGNYDHALQHRVIGALKPDLVALQEVDRKALPSGPLCATRAPDMAQWQVIYKAQPPPKPAANGATAAPAPAKPPEPDGSDFQKTIIKNRTLYHVQWTTGARFVVEKWCLQDVQVTTLPNAQFPVISTPDERDDYYMDFSRSDFHGFEWISGKNFIGVQSIGGVECMVFKDTLKGPEGETHEAQAVVDYKTRLPVSLQVGEGLTTYQFSAAPSSQLNPPARIAGLADQWRKRLKQARLSPPP